MDRASWWLGMAMIALPLMWVAAAIAGFVMHSAATMFKWGWRAWEESLSRWGLVVAMAAAGAMGCASGAPRPYTATEPRRIIVQDAETLRRVLGAMRDCVRLDVHRAWVGFAVDGTPVTVRYWGGGEAPDMACGGGE